MKGTLQHCNLTSTQYNYQEFANQLQSQYGFEELGSGSFGVVLGASHCTVKLVKDINRCQELKHEKQIYEEIEKHKHLGLIGRIPQFNLYQELNTFCHFNMEKIYAPIVTVDDGDKQRVGYVIDELNNNYLFKDLKPKRGIYHVPKNNVHHMPWRKLIHFYVNHYDLNFKYKSDERGDIMGQNVLITNFTQNKVQEFSFAVGQLLSFIILDCQILPFDVEIVIGTSEVDYQSTIYMYDFNECVFIQPHLNMNILASEAARSMYSKDGRHYYPNQLNPFYQDFYNGLIDHRTANEIIFIDTMLNHYQNYF
jgi:hypothetical protein